MNSKLIHIMLADDDNGNYLFLGKALKKNTFTNKSTTANNSIHLMAEFTNISKLPIVIFLDSNTPSNTPSKTALNVYRKLKHLQYLGFMYNQQTNN